MPSIRLRIRRLWTVPVLCQPRFASSQRVTATSRNGESDRNVNQVEIVSHLENYMSDTDILRASTASGVVFSIRFTFYLTHRYGK